MAPTKKTTPTPLTEIEVREMVENLLRNALSEQARDLEKHLNDIHKRLVKVESQPRRG
jgi:hypothetical protein